MNTININNSLMLIIDVQEKLVNMITDSLETLTEGVIAIMELNCVVNVN